MEERLKFVARLLDGEKMASLCREFGISRKTGYKIFNRYKELGIDGLNDQSRRPHRYANQLPFQVERRILAIKKERPTWGAPKIREKLIREYPQIRPPAKSTVHAVLERHGLVKRRKARRYRAQGTELSHGRQPNAPWCADYKGQFLLGNKRYCYPQTITDYKTRYLLACDALDSTKENYAITVFERTFQKRELEALPGRIEALEDRQLVLTEETSKTDFYQQDPAHVKATLKSLADVSGELEQTYLRWAELEDAQS